MYPCPPISSAQRAFAHMYSPSHGTHVPPMEHTSLPWNTRPSHGTHVPPMEHTSHMYSLPWNTRPVLFPVKCSCVLKPWTPRMQPAKDHTCVLLPMTRLFATHTKIPPQQRASPLLLTGHCTCPPARVHPSALPLASTGTRSKLTHTYTHAHRHQSQISARAHTPAPVPNQHTRAHTGTSPKSICTRAHTGTSPKSICTCTRAHKGTTHL